MDKLLSILIKKEILLKNKYNKAANRYGLLIIISQRKVARIFRFANLIDHNLYAAVCTY